MEKSGQNSRNGLSDRGRVGGQDWLQRRAEISRVSVRQTLDGHGRQPRPLCWSFMGWRQACVASQSQRRLWDVRYTGGGRLERRVEQWAAQWRNVSPDWLITYPMQAVHPVYMYCNGIFCKRHRMYTSTKIHFISIFSALTSYYV